MPVWNRENAGASPASLTHGDYCLAVKITDCESVDLSSNLSNHPFRSFGVTDSIPAFEAVRRRFKSFKGRFSTTRRPLSFASLLREQQTGLYAGGSLLEECLPCKQDLVGSNPITGSKTKRAS